MSLSKSDRIAFSFQIIEADAKIKGLATVKDQLQSQIIEMQNLDNANANLFNPSNILVNQYQSEFTLLDGNTRTSILEQNIQDSANKKIQNFFYPNDVSVTVPSLSTNHNIWTKVKPYALTYVIGKNYTETFSGITVKESDKINAALTLITSAAAYTNMQNTTGQIAEVTGTCSLPAYTNQTDCLANSGTWTPGPDSIHTYTVVQTLKTNLVNAINDLKSFLNTELSSIVITDTVNQSINQAAQNNITATIIPALNLWLSYSDFNTSHGQTTVAGFNSYNSNLLAPTKLHSTQLTALQTALNNRLTFLSTRQSQLSTILGTVVQDLSTGDINSTLSSGLYLKRYNLLLLRIDLLSGSLTQLVGLQTASTAQDSIKNSTINNKNTYYSILPTSAFLAPATGNSSVNLIDVSFLSVGDTVFIVGDGLEELQRAVKSINGNYVTLNDVIPAKYGPGQKARLYKDLT